MILFKLEFKT